MDQPGCSRCPSCGTENLPGSAFCKFCGSTLTSQAAPTCEQAALSFQPGTRQASPTTVSAAQPSTAQAGSQTPPAPDQGQYAPTGYGSPPPFQAPQPGYGYAPPQGAYPPASRPVPPHYAPPQGGFPPPPQKPPLGVDTIDGIPVDEVAEFIGPGAEKFLPKFAAMETGAKRNFFHPLVFFLTLFFGPVAGALWFFHRRMNKIGAALTAVGGVLTAASLVTLYMLMDTVTDYIWLVYHAAERNGPFPNPFSTQTDFGMWLIVLIVVSLVTLGVTVGFACYFGLNADRLYKNHIVRTIRRDVPVHTDGSADKAALRKRGGTRAAAWITVLVLYFVISMAVAFACMIPFMNDIFTFISEVDPGYSYGYSYDYHYNY